MRRRFRRFHYKHYHRPTWWLKLRAMFAQILIPLIGFQLIRTLLLPTTFDVILLSLMIVLYFSVSLRFV
jgi:uncharacterized membrane-anchored protein